MERPWEHFGYHDGVSQPIFLCADLPPAGQMGNWDPGAGLNKVLVLDGLAKDQDCFGSFFVSWISRLKAA